VADLPTGTVTFLFTDIEGRMKLAQAHPAKWESARPRLQALKELETVAQIAALAPGSRAAWRGR
jgi:hypothetical protein